MVGLDIGIILKHFILAALLAPALASAAVQVVVKDAWVRATVTQQKATGVFMQLITSERIRLVDVRASIAGAAELHEMSLDNDLCVCAKCQTSLW